MELKIYTERLKEGQKETFSGSISCLSMPEEKDLSFKKEIELSGEAYVAGDHLIIKLDAKAIAFMPCCVCNNPVTVQVNLCDFYHAEPLEEIKSSIFDFSELVRTDLLLQLPQFAECQGSCSERKNLKQFLKEKNTACNANFPFAEL